MLALNYTLLKGDYEGLKRQNEELTDYKHRYEKLQSDLQNNAIAASMDSK
jgi:hypothetical protein